MPCPSESVSSFARPPSAANASNSAVGSAPGVSSSRIGVNGSDAVSASTSVGAAGLPNSSPSDSRTNSRRSGAQASGRSALMISSRCNVLSFAAHAEFENCSRCGAVELKRRCHVCPVAPISSSLLAREGSTSLAAPPSVKSAPPSSSSSSAGGKPPSAAGKLSAVDRRAFISAASGANTGSSADSAHTAAHSRDGSHSGLRWRILPSSSLLA
mmetsp:Transcript_19786/g.50316  ORF Transcript_19786/g.50316 Transcript_19786/m.50316 type:complete len:213 (+) Transcript_19786:251-889(+)